MSPQTKTKKRILSVSRRKKFEKLRQSFAFTAVMLLFASCALGICSLFLATSKYGHAMFLSYLRSFWIITLNLLPVVLFTFLLYFLINRAAWAFGLSAGLTMLATLINYMKMLHRNDPLIAEDVTLFLEAANMGQKYPWELKPVCYIIIGLCMLGIIFAAVFMRGRIGKKRRRAIGALICVAVFAVLFKPLYLNNNVYNEWTRNEELISPWSENQRYISKGFIYPFLHSISYNINTEPEGYDENKAASELSSYANSDIPADKKVDIIAIMLESYTDFTDFNEIDFNIDVYKTLHDLESESLHGDLITNIFAGGTVDTERAFITGFSDLGNFRRPTNSYAWYMRQQGYYVEGAHGCFEWFYNRENINEYLGFEDYKFVENYYAPYSYDNVAPDYLFIPSIFDLYEAHEARSDKPYFSFSVSYQGHGPYSGEKLTDTEYAVRKSYYNETDYNYLNNYLASIYDTNTYLEQLFDYFRESGEPVVVVLFGDHKPWLGEANSTYEMLGISLELSEEEGFYNYYSAPYLIWANDAAKTVLGHEIRGDGGDISPCFLMNRVFDALGWEGNSFMKASREIERVTDVLHTSGVYCACGELTKELKPRELESVLRYRQIEYYWQNNFAYGDLIPD
ncbi:MAG: sulfatase-like hydrolase/transferase [Oscillospiraceae bacterium]|jgi:phosphoglycerol transferase MdoB-like AlkP superfamily enzyme